MVKMWLPSYQLILTNNSIIALIFHSLTPDLLWITQAPTMFEIWFKRQLIHAFPFSVLETGGRGCYPLLLKVICQMLSLLCCCIYMTLGSCFSILSCIVFETYIMKYYMCFTHHFSSKINVSISIIEGFNNCLIIVHINFASNQKLDLCWTHQYFFKLMQLPIKPWDELIISHWDNARFLHSHSIIAGVNHANINIWG